jgi:4-hydroxy-3-polyprenylbenzoate decarboxylase
MGKPLEAAVVVGASPNIGYVSVSRAPKDMDEFAIAGSIAGEPLELVKCKTVDIEVPAHAEVVIEGEIVTDDVEPEAPFGEAHGHMGQRELAYYFNVKCITHRKDPIWQAFISQMPPSESSVIRGIACANVIPNRLIHELKMPWVRDVAVHFASGNDRYSVIQVAKTEAANIWRAMEAMHENFPDFSKVVVAVDEDINPQNVNLVNWAITYRAQPHRDFRIVKIKSPDIWGDYSAFPPPPDGQLQRPSWLDYRGDDFIESSYILIDATRKWPYPPVSLPKKEFMEGAINLWQKLGLPKLGKLAEPWYGYNMGYWSKEDEEQAELALEGEHYKTGEVLAQRREKID